MLPSVGASTLSRSLVETVLGQFPDERQQFKDDLDNYRNTANRDGSKRKTGYEDIPQAQREFIAVSKAMHELMRRIANSKDKKKRAFRNLVGPVYYPPNPLNEEEAQETNVGLYQIKRTEYALLNPVFFFDPEMQYGQKRKCPCGCGLDANSQAYTDPREIIDIEGIIHVISRQFKVEKRPTCIAKINEMKAEAEIKLAVRRGQLEGMVKSESGKNDLAALSRTTTPAASVSWMAHDEIGMASLTPEQREDVPIIFRSKSGTTRQLDNILLPLSTEVSFNTLELLVRRLHEESRMRNVSKHAATGAVTYLIDLMKINTKSHSPFIDTTKLPSQSLLRDKFIESTLANEENLLDAILTVVAEIAIIDETFKITQNLDEDIMSGVLNLMTGDGRVFNLLAFTSKGFNDLAPSLALLDERLHLNDLKLLEVICDDEKYLNLIKNGFFMSDPKTFIDLWHKVANVISATKKHSLLRNTLQQRLFFCLMGPHEENGSYRPMLEKDVALSNLDNLRRDVQIMEDFDGLVSQQFDLLVGFTSLGRFDRLHTDYLDATGTKKTGRAGIENFHHHLNDLKRDGKIGSILWYCLVLVFTSHWNLNASRRLPAPHPVKNAGFSNNVGLIQHTLAHKKIETKHEGTVSISQLKNSAAMAFSRAVSAAVLGSPSAPEKSVRHPVINGKKQVSVADFFTKTSPKKKQASVSLSKASPSKAAHAVVSGRSFLESRLNVDVAAITTFTEFEKKIFFRFRVEVKAIADNASSIERLMEKWEKARNEETVVYQKSDGTIVDGELRPKLEKQFREMCLAMEGFHQNQFMFAKDDNNQFKLSDWNFRNIVCKKKSIQVINAAFTREPDRIPSADVLEFARLNRPSKIQYPLAITSRIPEWVAIGSNSINHTISPKKREHSVSLQPFSKRPRIVHTEAEVETHQVPPKGKHSVEATCKRCKKKRYKTLHGKSHCTDGFNSTFTSVAYYATDEEVKKHNGSMFRNSSGKDVPCFLSQHRKGEQKE